MNLRTQKLISVILSMILLWQSRPFACEWRDGQVGWTQSNSYSLRGIAFREKSEDASGRSKRIIVATLPKELDIATTLKVLGITVRMLRKRKGWNQMELARRTGCFPRDEISKIERIYRKNVPEESKLKALAKALGVGRKKLTDGSSASEVTSVEILAENVKRFREERGWTPAELAEKAGCLSGEQIDNIEEAKRDSLPGDSEIEALADALGVGEDFLLTESLLPIARRPTSRKGWLGLINELAEKYKTKHPGEVPTEKELPFETIAKITWLDIIAAMINHGISWEEAGLAKGYRLRSEWIVLMHALVKAFKSEYPGRVPTPNDLEALSNGVVTAREIRKAVRNCHISWREAGIRRQKGKNAGEWKTEIRKLAADYSARAPNAKEMPTASDLERVLGTDRVNAKAINEAIGNHRLDVKALGIRKERALKKPPAERTGDKKRKRSHKGSISRLAKAGVSSKPTLARTSKRRKPPSKGFLTAQEEYALWHAETVIDWLKSPVDRDIVSLQEIEEAMQELAEARERIVSMGKKYALRWHTAFRILSENKELEDDIDSKFQIDPGLVLDLKPTPLPSQI